jgi:hypothetical protein
MRRGSIFPMLQLAFPIDREHLKVLESCGSAAGRTRKVSRGVSAFERTSRATYEEANHYQTSPDSR